jgi:hypothetical protein
LPDSGGGESGSEVSMPRRSEFVEHVVETMRAFGPVEVLASPPEMAEWARLGFGAALRAAARKGAKGRTAATETGVSKKRTAPKKITAPGKRRQA